jgi:hypothetical protein
VEADEAAPAVVAADTVAEAHHTAAVAEVAAEATAAAVPDTAHHEEVATGADTAQEDQDTARTSLTSTICGHDHETSVALTHLFGFEGRKVRKLKLGTVSLLDLGVLIRRRTCMLR